MGLDLVPPTVHPRRAARRGQRAVVRRRRPPAALLHDLREPSRPARRSCAAFAVFDLLANNTDRKSGHVLIDADDHLWGIDHGLCFAADFKLRTVIWEFGGEPVARAPARRRRTRWPSAVPLDVAALLDDDEVEACRSARSGSSSTRCSPSTTPAAATPGRWCERRRRRRRRRRPRRARRTGPTSTGWSGSIDDRCSTRDWEGLLRLRDRARAPRCSPAGSCGRRRRSPSTGSPSWATGRVGRDGARRGERPVHDRSAHRGGRPAPRRSPRCGRTSPAGPRLGVRRPRARAPRRARRAPTG